MIRVIYVIIIAALLAAGMPVDDSYEDAMFY